MEITLKRATEKDVDAYIWVAQNAKSPINLATTDPEEVLAEIQNSDVFIIQCDGTVAGYVSYEKRTKTHVYISELAVHSDFRRRGIGDWVLKKILSDLRREGFTSFELVTHPDNQARFLYQQNGFVVTNMIKNYDQSGTPRLVLSCSS